MVFFIFDYFEFEKGFLKNGIKDHCCPIKK